MIGLSIGPQLSLALVCQVCDRSRNRAAVDDGVTGEILFGSKPYAICPGCHMEAHASLMTNPEYRRRARVRHFEDTGHVWPLDAYDDVPPPKPGAARRGRSRRTS